MKKSSKTIGIGIGVVAALAISASTTQAQNLLVNGSFENAGGFTANPITTTSGPGATTGVDLGWATFGGSQDSMSSDPTVPFLICSRKPKAKSPRSRRMAPTMETASIRLSPATNRIAMSTW